MSIGNGTYSIRPVLGPALAATPYNMHHHYWPPISFSSTVTWLFAAESYTAESSPATSPHPYGPGTMEPLRLGQRRSGAVRKNDIVLLLDDHIIIVQRRAAGKICWSSIMRAHEWSRAARLVGSEMSLLCKATRDVGDRALVDGRPRLRLMEMIHHSQCDSAGG